MHPELKGWLVYLGIDSPELERLKEPLGCRAFYRIISEIEKHLLVLDASGCAEVVPKMIGMNLRMKDAKVATPLMRAFEMHKGFLLMEDVGEISLQDRLYTRGYDTDLIKGVDLLCKMQKAPTDGLKRWSKVDLMASLDGVIEYYLRGIVRIMVGCGDTGVCLDAFELIADELMCQPQGAFVHGCLTPWKIKLHGKEVVLLGFSEAQIGGYVYDFATLCQTLPMYDAKVYERIQSYFCEKQSIGADKEQFKRWFDFSNMHYTLKEIAGYAEKLRKDRQDEHLASSLEASIKRFLSIASHYEELEAFCAYLADPKSTSGSYCQVH